MASVSKNVYIDKLDFIVNKYNNTNHSTIRMSPIGVKSSTHIYFNTAKNDKNPKFKVGDHVRISKYKKHFGNGYASNWSEEAFVNKNFKNIVPRTYVIENINRDETVAKFYEKELEKTNQTEFRVEKAIKRKGVKLYVTKR